MNLKDIKQRIDSVKKTQKITQAMKMVAASKFKRAQNQLEQLSAYRDEIQGVMTDLFSRIELDQIIPMMDANTNAKKELLIVIASDRGLCGGFNTYILKASMQYIQERPEGSVDVISIGNKASSFFKRRGINVVDTYSNLAGNCTESEIAEILVPVIEQYNSADYRSVTVWYNKFISALQSEQTQAQLLPIVSPSQASESDDETQGQASGQSDFFYEPSKTAVLTALCTQYISYLLYAAIKDSYAAEEGARMAAMDSASENAKDVILDLTLLYNRQRQAAITTELTEIVAGAASLN